MDFYPINLCIYAIHMVVYSYLLHYYLLHYNVIHNNCRCLKKWKNGISVCRVKEVRHSLLGICIFHKWFPCSECVLWLYRQFDCMTYSRTYKMSLGWWIVFDSAILHDYTISLTTLEYKSYFNISQYRVKGRGKVWGPEFGVGDASECRIKYNQ